MKRVLVTGASGFVGRHCLPALTRRGFQVVAVSSRARPPEAGELRWLQADLLEGNCLRSLVREAQPTHLLHLAWVATPGVFWHSPDNSRWLEASQRLLRAFQELGGRRAVGVGTCAEYDWRHGYCREDATPLNPSTAYGQCKRAVSVYLNSLAEQTQLSAAWARLFFLYGPHAPWEKFPMPVLTALSHGEPARCTHGRQVRDFLHVRDAAEALAALLDSHVPGPVNVASGVPVCLAEIARWLADRLGRAALLQLGALEARADEPPLLVGDVTRLTRGVGFSPRYRLADGLEDLVAWWERRALLDAAA